MRSLRARNSRTGNGTRWEDSVRSLGPGARAGYATEVPWGSLAYGNPPGLLWSHAHARRCRQLASLPDDELAGGAPGRGRRPGRAAGSAGPVAATLWAGIADPPGSSLRPGSPRR